MAPSDDDSLGPVVIGPREIYDKLVLLGETTGEVCTEVKIMRHEIQDLKQDVEEYKTRLSQVERKVWTIPAPGTIIAALALVITAMQIW